MSEAKTEPSTSTPADTSTSSQVDPPNLANPLTTVTTQEELSILKCTNKEEAIAYEKHLRKLAEKVIWHFQKGLNAGPEDAQLKDVMPALIKDSKDTILGMYEPVHWANQKEVWNSIKDPEAKCIWSPGDDNNGAQDVTVQATVQEEELVHSDAEEFIQALDKPLTDEQALMITDLFWSHACMLEWQGQVSMLLSKLATSVSPTLYLAILNSTVKSLH